MSKITDFIIKTEKNIQEGAKNIKDKTSTNVMSGSSAYDYDKIVEEQRKNLENTKNTQKDAINKTHDSQVTVLKDQYGQAIADTSTAYESEYQKNAVQKLINEKMIAERNANLGLTDSGLNRTQQTAAQLSYANNKGNIDLAKRSALDTLSQSLASSLAGIEQSRITGLANVDTNIENQAHSNAYDIYKTNVEANAAVQKAAIEAAAKAPTVSYGAGGTRTGGYIVSSPTGTLSRDYMGSLEDNGISTVYSYNTDGSIKKVTYTDSNSGISASFDGGVNPYTGRMHKDLRDENGAYDPSKAFVDGNGYQPNNIDGKKLKDTGATWIVNNREQRVFKVESDKDNKYYVWRGDLGYYQKLTDDEASKVGLY